MIALQKDYVMADGNTGNYWVIQRINMDSVNETASLVLFLYKDAATKAAGGTPMCAFELSVPTDDWDANLAEVVLLLVDVSPSVKMYPWVQANAVNTLRDKDGDPYTLADATPVS